ncbi:hypothetical protein MTO96_046757 [Rhipicephalus appendiculatus]
MCGINDASKGSLSSYAIIMLTLYYLPQCGPPVIPVLQGWYPEGEKKPQVKVDGWNAWFDDDIDNLVLRVPAAGAASAESGPGEVDEERQLNRENPNRQRPNQQQENVKCRWQSRAGARPPRQTKESVRDEQPEQRRASHDDHEGAPP